MESEKGNDVSPFDLPFFSILLENPQKSTVVCADLNFQLWPEAELPRSRTYCLSGMRPLATVSGFLLGTVGSCLEPSLKALLRPFARSLPPSLDCLYRRWIDGAFAG